MKTNLETLQSLRAQMRKYVDTLNEYEKIFKADGIVDCYEDKQLGKLRSAIQKIDKSIDEKEEKLGYFNGEKIKNWYAKDQEKKQDDASTTDDIVDHSLVAAREVIKIFPIKGSVGAKADNKVEDVKIVQTLLKGLGYDLGAAGVNSDGVDGCSNTKLIDAIKAFQDKMFSFTPDGNIGAGGKTWKALSKGKVEEVTIDTSKLSAEMGLGHGENDSDSYRSQRDNPELPGGTCNVTTLAMQLISLADGDEASLRATAVELLAGFGTTASVDTQLEELLRLLCFAKYGETETLSNGDVYKSWEVAYVLDYVSELFSTYVSKTSHKSNFELSKKGYDKAIVPALNKGAEIMLSNNLTNKGHIVKLESVRADGIVINDPYGCLVVGAGKYLKNGAKITSSLAARIKDNKNTLEVRLQTNTSLKKKLYALAEAGSGEFPGDNGKFNFYTWSEVETYKIGKWANITHQK